MFLQKKTTKNKQTNKQTTATKKKRNKQKNKQTNKQQTKQNKNLRLIAFFSSLANRFSLGTDLTVVLFIRDMFIIFDIQSVWPESKASVASDIL